MRWLLSSLQGKLILTLVALIVANSAFFAVLTIMTTRTHMQAVEQSVNRDLAKRILSEQWLAEASATRGSVVMAFDRLMAVNPDIEVYRIGPTGEILEYSAPAGHVVRDRVSIEPIQEFLLASSSFPIVGDDPRSLTGTKVFSAAAIERDGVREGYLYVVLGGEAYETVARMLRGNYNLRFGLGLAAGGVVLVVLIGVATFHLLTKRFRKLTGEMRAFRESDFRHTPLDTTWQSTGFSDEIDEAGETFRKMCDRIRDQIQMLESADKSRREMVANISHDLRTPLATLRGYLETLLMKEAELSDAVRRRYLELSLDYGERLSQLIMELFELSTLDTPSTELEVVPFSIAELAHDVAEKSNLEAERKGIHFVSDISPTTPFILGDIGLVERVFEKLLENALRFTPPGGTVRLVIATSDDRVIARVEDTGPGIADEDLPRIFDRFYRGDSARIEPGDGAGLGLAIARRIVELHGGSIGVERSKNGASFFFALPVAPT